MNAATQVAGSSKISSFTGSPAASWHKPNGTTRPFQASNTGTPVSGAGLNDSGVIADKLNKSGDGASAVASLPCDTTLDGAHLFCVDVIANGPVLLDPIVAQGYDHAIGNGDPSFATVTSPTGFGDSLYTLDVVRDTFPLAGGYPNGVAEFEVLGVETGAMLDPLDPTAFVTEVTFTGPGNSLERWRRSHKCPNLPRSRSSAWASPVSGSFYAANRTHLLRNSDRTRGLSS
ncbi:MAG TPA: hypothetical protein VGQ19_03795 [Burkholderiales bacterium]|jgi:hypothetical protein|nr:hypothetical protein [Burkholderiales bacterium]